VPILGSVVSVEESPNDVSDGTNVVQADLPGARELVSMFLARVVTVLVAESRVSKEGAHESGIIAFHDD